MSEQWIPATYMRGGTSKGVFFREDVLPPPGADRDAILLSVMGSPDLYGRQLDGMGGGASSVSKIVSVAPSQRDDADVEYTFGQVAVDSAVVDYSSNCGNLSSAVGPFAVDEGLVEAADGELTLRIFNTNTSTLLRAVFDVRDGRAVTGGDLAIPGVSGAGAPIRLDYLDPGGAKTGRVLPTGAATVTVHVDAGDFTISCVDVTAATVFVDAAAVGLTGIESPAELAADPATLATLDQLRRAGAVAMGLAATPGDAALAGPKIAVVSGPRQYRTISGDQVSAGSYHLAVRMISMEQPHAALPGTGALCLAAAAQIPGTIPYRVSSRPGASPTMVGTPSGVLTVGADVDPAGPSVRSASLYRTARALMGGAVAYRR